MSTAKEDILRRVRTALTDVPDDDHTPVPRDYAHLAGEADTAALFADRVAEYQATVHRCDAEQLPAAVAECLAAQDARRLVVPADVPYAWLGELAEVDVVRDDGSLAVAELDHVDSVVTGCAVGIALTGTVVLDGGVAQGRRALTLVPDHHVCVVRADQIVGSVPEAIGQLNPHRPLTFVSGPSATSDIELDRVEGVHGPRFLDVLLVT